MSQSVVSEHFVEAKMPLRAKPTPVAVLFLAGAAALCALAGQPPWAALAGWMAYYTRGSTLRDGAYNLACAVTGLGLAIVAQTVEAGMQPSLGIYALPLALLFAVGSIYLLKLMTGVDNIPSYFIGLLVMFASQLEPSLDSYLTLTAAITSGAFAAALPQAIREMWRSSDADSEAQI